MVRTLVVLASCLALASGTVPSPESADAPARLGFDLGPVHGFVPNQGQWRHSVRMAAGRAGQWALVDDAGVALGCGHATIALRPRVVAMASPSGQQPTGAQCNFLRGERSGHVTGVPVFATVERELVDGVDWILRSSRDAAGFAHDLRVRDVAAELPVFDVEGAERLVLDHNTGALIAETRGGTLRQSAPIAWSQLHGIRTPIPCRFELCGRTSFRFVLDVPHGAGEFYVDPDLVWQAAVGGNNSDRGRALAVAANGDTFVAGSALSADLPTTTGVFGPTYSGTAFVPAQIGDAYVARLSGADGSLVWCTYVGGLENDRFDVVLADGDEAIAGGWTSSLDYPTTPASYDTSHNGVGDGIAFLGGDVVVTRLSADGQSLVYSTFLGGSQLEYVTSMALSTTGEVAISGHVHSPNFPTTSGAYSDTMTGFSDMFYARLSADGSTLVASTYFGSATGEEYPFAMAITANDDVVLVGATDGSDLPVTPGAYDTTYNGGSDHFADAFGVRFDRLGQNVAWCSFFGTAANEYARGLVWHGDGTMTITGQIDGPGLPTTAAVHGPNPFGMLDGFAWKVTDDGATSLWASYYGGGDEDRFARCVDLGGGRVAVAGRSRSPDVPWTAGSAGPASIGNGDAVLAILDGDGELAYATAIGGNFGDWAWGVQRCPDGGLVAAGSTFSRATFMTTPGTPNFGGFGDAFVTKVHGLPDGVVRSGTPSGACGRNVRIQSRSAPTLGSGAFGLSAGTVPAFAPTLVAVAAGLLGQSVPLLGIDLWVDGSNLLATVGATVDGYGSALIPLPIPGDPALVGTQLAAQFVWLDACPGLGFGASDAVAIVVQP